MIGWFSRAMSYAPPGDEVHTERRSFTKKPNALFFLGRFASSGLADSAVSLHTLGISIAMWEQDEEKGASYQLRRQHVCKPPTLYGQGRRGREGGGVLQRLSKVLLSAHVIISSRAG